MIDPRLLEILVCPVARAPLRYDADAQELISDSAGLAYPIRDSVPVMLPDEARRLDLETSCPHRNRDGRPAKMNN